MFRSYSRDSLSNSPHSLRVVAPPAQQLSNRSREASINQTHHQQQPPELPYRSEGFDSEDEISFSFARRTPPPRRDTTAERYTRPSNVVDRLMQAEENRRARLLQMQVEDAQRKEQVIKVPQMNAKSMLQLKQEKLDNLLIQIEKEKLLKNPSPTFHPRITSSSSSQQQSHTERRSFDQFLTHVSAWNRKKHQRHEEITSKVLSAEIRGSTFQPKLNQNSLKIANARREEGDCSRMNHNCSQWEEQSDAQQQSTSKSPRSREKRTKQSSSRTSKRLEVSQTKHISPYSNKENLTPKDVTERNTSGKGSQNFSKADRLSSSQHCGKNSHLTKSTRGSSRHIMQQLQSDTSSLLSNSNLFSLSTYNGEGSIDEQRRQKTVITSTSQLLRYVEASSERYKKQNSQIQRGVHSGSDQGAVSSRSSTQSDVRLANDREDVLRQLADYKEFQKYQQSEESICDLQASRKHDSSILSQRTNNKQSTSTQQALKKEKQKQNKSQIYAVSSTRLFAH